MYPSVVLHIDGAWRPALDGKSISVINPATEEEIGTVAQAGIADLDEALAAASRGFSVWRAVSPLERSKIMRKAADLVRERSDIIARYMTLEQGKPLAEAKGETLAAADIIDWMAEEGRRTYGRVIPARAPGVYQLVIKEPVGPVAAFTPWNFPLNQTVRKLAAAVAAGCSIIVKASEETPASPAELVRAFVDAGVPAGVVNLVYGIPAQISEYLIPHPVIEKISFTGSTSVGKHLAALAGAHMKRATMELGGHGPAVIFEDADVDTAARVLSGAKYRNAGQVCVAPTRFLVQRQRYDEFVAKFVAGAQALTVGDGMAAGTTMGPLVSGRRVAIMEELVTDAISHGALLKTGGARIENRGFYFQPTVLADVPTSARIMNEEPFGPLAIINPFDDVEEAYAEANRLRYGLAAYAYTRSTHNANMLASRVAAGMVSINHYGLALPEVPFGGMKDSGYGSEGGSEALEAYLNTKFVTQAS